MIPITPVVRIPLLRRKARNVLQIDPAYKYYLTPNSCPLAIPVVENGTPLGIAHYVNRIDDRIRYSLGNRIFVLKLPKKA